MLAAVLLAQIETEPADDVRVSGPATAPAAAEDDAPSSPTAYFVAGLHASSSRKDSIILLAQSEPYWFRISSAVPNGLWSLFPDPFWWQSPRPPCDRWSDVSLPSPRLRQLLLTLRKVRKARASWSYLECNQI